jgi:hypothetical protein
LFLIAAPTHATTLAQAAFRTSISGPTTTVICQDGGSGETYASVSCDQDTNYGVGRASASYGQLGTYARLHSVAPPSDNHHYQAYGWAEFTDQLIFGSGLLDPGVSTNARIVFQLDGSLVSTPPDFMSGGTLELPIDERFVVKIGGLALQPSNGPVTLNKELHYDFDVFPDIPINFKAELRSDVRCWGCFGAYEGIVDLENTASVSAVLVQDPDSGEFLDLSDFTVTSGAGASYANVVPEPTTALLLASGLIALAIRARRGGA